MKIKLLFVFCILIIVLSQYRLFIATKQLSFEQLAFEFNFSTKQNLIYSCAILAGILLIIAVPSLWSWLIFLIIVLTFGTWVQISIYQCLKKRNYPKSYLRALIIYSFITYLAELGLILCFFLST